MQSNSILTFDLCSPKTTYKNSSNKVDPINAWIQESISSQNIDFSQRQQLVSGIYVQSDSIVNLELIKDQSLESEIKAWNLCSDEAFFKFERDLG